VSLVLSSRNCCAGGFSLGFQCENKAASLRLPMLYPEEAHENYPDPEDRVTALGPLQISTPEYVCSVVSICILNLRSNTATRRHLKFSTCIPSSKSSYFSSFKATGYHRRLIKLHNLYPRLECGLDGSFMEGSTRMDFEVETDTKIIIILLQWQSRSRFRWDHRAHNRRCNQNRPKRYELNSEDKDGNTERRGSHDENTNHQSKSSMYYV
jgi:hypothetical protein